MRPILLSMITMLTMIGYTGVAQAQTRDQIKIVGSSTVFPFSTAVAEEFGRSSRFRTPIVEATGSGGGFKLFCAGVGLLHPDITNASRKILKSELDMCVKNGVSTITEIKIGYDGIVIANVKGAHHYQLTLREIYMALAKEIPNTETNSGFINNPYQRWNEINPNLPNIPIKVMGPPPTSGTRDALNVMALEAGCRSFPQNRKLEQNDQQLFRRKCRSIREDGAFIEEGENDNLIVQKLLADKNALGIFGYSFLDQNNDIMQGAMIATNGQDYKKPTFENITSGAYPVSRSLFFYVKNIHVSVVPGIHEFINAFTSDMAWGEEGYLSDRGLIPLQDDERIKVAQTAKDLVALPIQKP